ncbi:MAG TPA: hypothetical protein VL404_08110 [Candidatus Eisenbacteria bacterium]|jgi:hypothetical protein|nr:hypothetical protein [Candidatus Eisenbacteria bacterium]
MKPQGQMTQRADKRKVKISKTEKVYNAIAKDRRRAEASKKKETASS